MGVNYCPFCLISLIQWLLSFSNSAIAELGDKGLLGVLRENQTKAVVAAPAARIVPVASGNPTVAAVAAPATTAKNATGT